MATVTVNDSNLYDIADSIRAKLGVQTTYKPSEMADAIDSISGGGITPTGEIEITANGTYDVTQYASAEVDVPTGSTPVINSLSVTENGTYTAPTGVDGYSPITVNVPSGGEYTIDDIFTQTQPSGDVVIGVVSMPVNYMAYRTGITKITAPNLDITANLNTVFYYCTNMKYAILPKYTRIYNNCFGNCSQLIGVDCIAGYIGSTVFTNCPKFNLLIIRKTDAIATLSNTNSFSSCCFSTGKTGGTLYVPNDLIASYQASTNWATVLGYNANNQILPIEGSYYETHYADGTEIPT